MNMIQHLKLRERRLRKCGTLAHWASLLRISTSQLSRLERGLVGRVDIELFELVKALYGISEEEARLAMLLSGRS